MQVPVPEYDDGHRSGSTSGVQFLEAIGYDYMSVTDIYKKQGVPLEFMTITEGGSNSEVWNQIKADMLGCKSATLENAQGAVLTDAVIAAYAVGDLEDPSQVFEKTRKDQEKFMNLI